MEIGDSAQLEKARLEDVLVELLYREYRDLVFHGGTAIWRCYGGNRFSRDLDFYMRVNGDTSKEGAYKSMGKFLRESGFALKESGFEKSTDTMHFLVESNTKMKVDVNFAYKRGAPTEYTRVDGSRMIVLSLTPTELLNEKIDAYEDKLEGARRFSEPEVQDLYDIYYLCSLAKDDSGRTAARLCGLIARIEKSPPKNAGGLGHLIMSGLAPSVELMEKVIREWVDDNRK